jgi:transcriptional regulator with XRE-family HTH domain
MTTDLTIGERIAFYRRRRGISQTVLADMIGRSTDWLSKVENGRISLDRLSVLRRIADRLDLSLGDLVAVPSLMEWTRDSGQATVPRLRSVLMDYRELTHLGNQHGATLDINADQMREQVQELWGAYQDSRFGYVAHRLVSIIPSGKALAQACSDAERPLVQGRLALAYQVAATMLTKLGESDLAWTAANHGIHAAHASEKPVIVGSVFRGLTHTLMATGAYAEAVQLTHTAVDFLEEHLAKPTRTMESVYGAQLLAGSMAAARSDDRETTRDFLAAAERTAARLGHDDNRLWTAFGPTNVTIHRVATAMELGAVQVALDLGPSLDTSALPTERRVRHALEVSRALTNARRRDEAVSLVLEAEQRAPEQVRYHFLSRQLVQTWLRTTRDKPSLELTGLAERLHIA